MLRLYLFPSATAAAVCSGNAAATQSVPYFGSGRTQKLGCWQYRTSIVSIVAVGTAIELRAKVRSYFGQNYGDLRV